LRFRIAKKWRKEKDFSVDSSTEAIIELTVITVTSVFRRAGGAIYETKIDGLTLSGKRWLHL
jgi:hypothetical protein